MNIIGFFKINQRWVYLLITALCFVFYGNTIKNEYNMDDARVTSTYNQKNKLVEEGFAGIPKIFNSRYKEFKNGDEEQVLGYRPIGRSTFAVEWGLWGQNPHRGHAINILLYAILCCLLYYILKISVFKSYNYLYSLLATVLFLAHPIHTEVVASLKNREELLSVLFGQLTFIMLWKYMTDFKLYRLIIATGLFFLAVFSKESVMIFMGLIPLFLFFFHPNASEKISRINLVVIMSILLLNSLTVATIDTILFASGLTIILFFIRFKYSNVFAIGIMLFFIADLAFKFPHTFLPPEININTFWENPLQGGNLSAANHIALILNTYLFYFKLLLYPYPLAFYYGYNVVPYSSLGSASSILAILTLAAMAAGFFYFFKKNKIVSFSIAAIVWSILLFSNIIPVPGIVAERLVFIASMPFCILASYALFELNKKYLGGSNKNLYFIYTPIIVLFLVLTYNRNTNWHSTETLYTRDIKYLNKSAKSNSMYGLMLLNKFKQEKNRSLRMQLLKASIKHFEIALKVYPKYSEPLTQLGTIYYNTDNLEKALYYFNLNYTYYPKAKNNALNLGVTYHAQNNYSMAKKFYMLSTGIDTKNAAPYRYLGNIYLKENKPDSVLYILDLAAKNHISSPELEKLRKK